MCGGEHVSLTPHGEGQSLALVGSHTAGKKYNSHRRVVNPLTPTVPVWAQWASKGYYIRTLALQFRRADAHAVYGGVHVTRRINFRYDLDV